MSNKKAQAGQTSDLGRWGCVPDRGDPVGHDAGKIVPEDRPSYQTAWLDTIKACSRYWISQLRPIALSALIYIVERTLRFGKQGAFIHISKMVDSREGGLTVKSKSTCLSAIRELEEIGLIRIYARPKSALWVEVKIDKILEGYMAEIAVKREKKNRITEQETEIGIKSIPNFRRERSKIDTDEVKSVSKIGQDRATINTVYNTDPMEAGSPPCTREKIQQEMDSIQEFRKPKKAKTVNTAEWFAEIWASSMAEFFHGQSFIAPAKVDFMIMRRNFKNSDLGDIPKIIRWVIGHWDSIIHGKMSWLHKKQPVGNIPDPAVVCRCIRYFAQAYYETTAAPIRNVPPQKEAAQTKQEARPAYEEPPARRRTSPPAPPSRRVKAENLKNLEDVFDDFFDKG